MSKNKLILILSLILIFQTISFSQKNFLRGKVYSNSEKKEVSLPFVNLYWAGTTEGVVSDENGNFRIKKISQDSDLKLVASFIAYENDTFLIKKNETFVKIYLKSIKELDGIIVRERIGGSYVSKISPIQTEKITIAGLQKLPCCNLAGSFENNASIDMVYSDAVSGAKQIEMLGLSGVYSQILMENMPAVRGLATTYGLAYIPGSWMESIQVSKGTSSVINGYESTTGQINVEFKKPENSEKLFLNSYVNHMGQVEGNLNSSYKFNDKLSTMIFLHAENSNEKNDRNKDGFLDMPKMSQFNFINRWKIKGIFGGKANTQFGVKILQEKRDGGQVDFDKSKDFGTTNNYGIGIETKRYEMFGKMGFLINHSMSIGSMISLTRHEQNSFFGLNNYDGKENSLYSNIIFRKKMIENHNLNFGASYIFDNYNENYNDSIFLRKESIFGVFGEYNYDLHSIFSLIIGLRADLNSEYGTFITPRIHTKYNIDENTIIRASAGRAYRTANIFAENIALLASSKDLIFEEELEEEVSWNFGVSLTKDFHIGTKEPLIFLVDFYHTRFENQVIVDLDKDISKVYFYNLKGESYSNSFQTELRYKFFKSFEIGTAFRWNDVKITSNGKLHDKNFTNNYKGLITFSYSTRFDKWNFDLTSQFNGKSRLPNTENLEEKYQTDNFSPSYNIFHMQITRKFKYWDIYVGAENLTDFRQKKTIIAADKPFGDNFDTSIIWGPLVGRIIYIGLRFTIK
ncbi:MAG: hypothetical protein B6I24_01375 [Bacteroidetes bacterium 4572_128]|nr:MAG: hypothetical protein B6I24_01375 [Bacteroidetes bacterium 4572_128]